MKKQLRHPLMKYAMPAAETVKRFLWKEMPVYAANSALFIELAAIPMLILLLTFVHRLPFLKEEQLVLMVSEYFPNIPVLQEFLRDLISEIMAGETAAVSFGSGLTALFSASSGIAALMNGLRKLYGYRRQNFISSRAEAVFYTLLFLLMVIFGMGSALLLPYAASLVEAGSSFLHMESAAGFLLQLLRYLRIFVIAFDFLILLCFYTIPFGKKHSLRSQAPGALLSAVGWQLAGSIFAFFITRVVSGSMIYGSLTALVLLSFWLLVLICILFMGASLNKVLADAKLDHIPEDEVF